MSSIDPATIVHLNVHSWYSLLSATAPVEALAARAAQDGMAQMALTDANVLYGAVAFQRACLAVDVQPIIGMTATVEAPHGMAMHRAPGELTLLATGPEGYRSLCRLSSTLQGTPARAGTSAARLTWDELKAHQEGLLCLSGGRRGWVDYLLRRGERAAAGRVVSWLAGVFGERAWLTIDCCHAAAETLGREIATLAGRFGIGTVAAQAIYCLDPDERARLHLLAAIARNAPLDALAAEDRLDGGDPDVTLHWLSPQEMVACYAAFPGALHATASVAAACQPALPDGRPIWPVLALPAGQTPDQALTAQVAEGLQTRYGAALPRADWEDLMARRDAELAAISSHGFAPLFLLVADIVRYARSRDIPVSTRGSVANSLVAYCIGITTVDPIEHDLLFERFLNPARTSLPDIDLDFCSVRRDEVLEYVRRTYGADRVALVATISTLRLRSALRETAKAYGLDETATARLVKRLPEDWHPDPRRRTAQTLEAALEKVDDPALHPVVRAAFGLLRQPDHLSVHPGGVVITPGPLTDVVPVQMAPKGFLITQFDHGDVEALGLPKIDLLGIRALTVLADAAEIVRTQADPAFRVDAIPLDDALTGAMLARGDAIGVFQCESCGAQRTLRQLAARTVQDLAVANAFFKPGPALGGMVQHFIRRYRGEEPVSYLHPALAPILHRTKGVLLFQEQILRIAREIAGLSWQEAEHLRKGMSKFQGAEMAAIRARFVAGCQRPAPDGPALNEAQARTLWEQVEPFAGYGFNQGHATAYADVSYRSAYVRAHWPAAFLCARLANWGGFHHPAIYIAEARRLGIDVRPPHVNFSQGEFTLVYEAAQAVLYMGLNQVRELRQTSVQTISEERSRAAFSDLADLLRRVPLQRKEIAHLIQCGALDGLGASRAALLAAAESSARGEMQQFSFDFMTRPVEAESAAQRLAWEEHILGQPISVHPLDLLQPAAEGVTSLVTVADWPRRAVQIIGVRLPGWTGGKGFFLNDRTHFCIAILPRGVSNPPVWAPVRIRGRWLEDEWGSGRLQVEQMERL
ncbi:DNA polymerase III subunit alpha [Caldilinea sp.]|uniref:DNA polymerase III subunit alpha n=1 Tax=Caldilinea sp. TaxID=2293560 RepID=UPI002C7F5653|nr:DNA polymerase III subunit alpha [Caldilinea sp.]